MPISRTPAPAMPGEYIVGFKPNTTAQQRARALQTLQPTVSEPLGLIDATLVKMPAGQPLRAEKFLRQADSVVEWVQPNYLHTLRDVPAAPAVNDPLYAKQYALHNTGQTGGTADADVNAPEAWQTSKGAGVVVAVVDTNVDIEHPDLKANIWTNAGEVAGNNVDDDRNGFVDDIHGWNVGANNNKPQEGSDSHGTHVSGSIAAAANNATGVAGVAPNAKIMPVALLTASLTTANALKAWDYAVKNGADIISNSWGNNTYEPALAAGVAKAAAAGKMVVVAAGNEDWDTGVNGSYPDNYAGAVSVAASDHKDAKASYSNRGTLTIDVAAPGDEIHSTTPRGRYANMSGTSMAAPAYSGVAALVKSAYPQLTMKQVEDRIFRSVRRTGTAAAWNPLVASGGRIDAAAALTPLATPSGIAVGGAQAARAAANAAPLMVRWGTDLAGASQRYEVQASTNADAVSTVNEDFETASTRKFRTAGDVKWEVAAGNAKLGTKSFQVNGLKGDKQSRLELTETLPESTEVSFWYKSSRAGELTFLINRDVQFKPTNNETWQQFKKVLPAGDYTFSWLGTGQNGTANGIAIDGLQIGKVSDAKWQNVGTTAPDVTEMPWTPADTAAGTGQVRVRANNGRFAGDWVASEQFPVGS